MSFILEIQFPNPPGAGAPTIEGMMEDELPEIGYEYLLSIPQVPSEESRTLFRASLEPSKPPYQATIMVKVMRVIKIVNLEKKVTEQRVIAQVTLGYEQYRRLANQLEPDRGWKLGNWR